MAIGTAAAIIGAGALASGASIIAGNKAAGAQKSAAQAQERLAMDQVAEERRQYDTTRADYAPYRETGYKALDTLAGLYGVGPNRIDPSEALRATPGYQFRMDEGQKLIERSAAARGALASGGTLKALTRYGQGVASDEYNAYSNRLAALAGVGQTATAGTAAAGDSAVSGMGTARQAVGNAIGAAGNARASSYANTGAEIRSGVNNLASAYLQGAFK